MQTTPVELSTGIAIIVGIPIFLAVCDLVFKRLSTGEIAHDTVSDLALAALTFNLVHLFTRLFGEKPITETRQLAMAVVWVVLQFAWWFGATFWSGWLRRNPSRRGWLTLSYLVGITLFAYSTSRALVLVQ